MIREDNYNMFLISEIIDDLFVKYIAYFNYRSYVQEMALKGNERVLEIGSGGGNLSRFLAEKLPKGNLVCIDLSKYWIEKARSRLKQFSNINFRLEDILNIKDNDFDVAVIHYVLHDISERGKVVDIVKDSLKNQGIVYIREPIRRSHGMPSEEIKKLMSERGFLEAKSCEEYAFPIRGKVYEGVFEK